MWNWPETFIVDDGWQDLRSETLLVDTEQVLVEDIHLIMSEHLLVQTETLEYPLTETMKEHRNLEFASNNESSKKSSVHFELPQESVDFSTVLHYVQQGKLFRVTMFYDSNLLLEEGNKCFELNESYGQRFVNEQQFALQDNRNERVMYQKLCHVSMKDDKPFNDDIKVETRTMIATLGRKSEFDFEINLVEETIPSHKNA